MLATASGLSEPVGAFIALFFIKPYLTPKLLHYLLCGNRRHDDRRMHHRAVSEGRKCKHDGHLLNGIVFGSLLMLSTLYVGV